MNKRLLCILILTSVSVWAVAQPDSLGVAVDELTAVLEQGARGWRRQLIEDAVPVLAAAIASLQLFLILFLPFVLWRNYRFARTQRSNARTMEQFNRLLSPYLTEPSAGTLPPQIKGRWSLRRRKLFLQYTATVFRIFGSPIRDRMLTAYRANVPERSVSLLFSLQSAHQKAQTFRRGAVVPPRGAVARQAERYIHSPHADLRLWARVVYVHYDLEQFGVLFGNERRALTRWERIVWCGVVQNLVRQGRDPSALRIERLASAPHESVVLLGRQLEAFVAHGSVPEELIA